MFTTPILDGVSRNITKPLIAKILLSRIANTHFVIVSSRDCKPHSWAFSIFTPENLMRSRRFRRGVRGINNGKV